MVPLGKVVQKGYQAVAGKANRAKYVKKTNIKSDKAKEHVERKVTTYEKMSQTILRRQYHTSPTLHKYKHLMNKAEKAGFPWISKAEEAQEMLYVSKKAVVKEHQLHMVNQTRNLPVANKIHKQLEDNGHVIVHGAPGSGKTEQIIIATQGRVREFDLKQEFIKDYAAANNIKEDAAWDKYNSLKHEETQWLVSNSRRIVRDLLKDPNPVVLFDEFDLGVSANLNDTEAKTAEQIVKMANYLKSKGKKVVFVLHDQGLNNLHLIKALEKKGFLAEEKEVVKSVFLNEKEQHHLLESFGFEEQDIAEIIEQTQGQPAVYLEYMKYVSKVFKGEECPLYKPTPESFLADAKKVLTKNFRVVKKNVSTRETMDLLEKIARGKISLKNNEVTDNSGALMGTGMIGTRGNGGGVILSPLSQEVILGEVAPKHSDAELIEKHNARLREQHFNERKYVIIKAEDIKDGFSGPIRVLEAIVWMAKTCGAVEIHPRVVEGIDVASPVDPKALDARLSELKSEVVNRLKPLALPAERDSIEHLSWTNSASTVSELIDNATKVVPVFTDLLNGIRKRTGCIISAGKNMEHMIKTELSLEAKVNKWTSVGEVSVEQAVKSINDSIRATVIAKDFNQLKDALEACVALAKEKGIDIVFSNKFEEDYKSGYVGVHAKAYMKVDHTDGSRIENMGEIQFHVEDIYDGTEDSTKETAHLYYKIDGTFIPAYVVSASYGTQKALYAKALEEALKKSGLGADDKAKIDK